MTGLETTNGYDMYVLPYYVSTIGTIAVDNALTLAPSFLFGRHSERDRLIYKDAYIVSMPGFVWTCGLVLWIIPGAPWMAIRVCPRVRGGYWALWGGGGCSWMRTMQIQPLKACSSLT